MSASLRFSLSAAAVAALAAVCVLGAERANAATTLTFPDLVFFNPNHPGVTFSLPGNGGVEWTTARPDGSSTITTTGHNVIFYFPTDTLLGNKPGPATLLVVGREVINVDAAGNFTQVSETGNVTDICAKLPPD
jgi:hypothetical protein